MAAPSLTYTLTNGNTADASQVMQDLNDILNGITDGTKDLTISALTMNGALNVKGNTTLGDAAGDDITVTGSLASTIPIKTNASFNIGSATLGLAGLYLGGGGVGLTCKLAAASHAATRVYTFPDAGAAANVVLSESSQTINGVLTFPNGLKPGTSQDTFNNYLNAGTWTPALKYGATTATHTAQAGFYWRVGAVVFYCGRVTVSNKNSGSGTATLTGFPITSASTTNMRWGCQFTNYTGAALIATKGGTIYGDMAANATVLTMSYTTSSGGTAVCIDSDINASSDFLFNGWYAA